MHAATPLAIGTVISSSVVTPRTLPLPRLTCCLSPAGPQTQRGQPYNPSALLAAVCRHATQFKGRQQHDAHELLRYLLDGLQTEQKRAEDMERKRSGALSRSPSSSMPGTPTAGTPTAAAVANSGSAAASPLGTPTAASAPSDDEAADSGQQEVAASPGRSGAMVRPSELVPERDPKLPGPSMVEQVFGGVLCSSILCSSCGSQSVGACCAAASHAWS